MTDRAGTAANVTIIRSPSGRRFAVLDADHSGSETLISFNF
jgi:hypothetical protein